MDIKLHYEDDPILSKSCEYFDLKSVNFDLDKLLFDMKQLMFRHAGIGLAAPQVGNLYNFFIMGDTSNMYYIFNPRILETGIENIKFKEGCLSFPDLWLNISRPKKIKVQYENIKGELKEDIFDNIWSRCFQHELDHLRGTCFTKKAGPTTLYMAKQKRGSLRRNK